MSGTRKSHDEVQELLGAFALDAVSEDEAAEVENHLRDCPRCRAEAEAHRDTAALLVDDHLEPPGELWDRLAARLEEAAPPIDLSQYRPPAVASRRLGTPRRLAAVAAVAALVIGTSALQRRGVERLEATLAGQELAVEALAAFNDPGARAATLRAGDGSVQLRAVLLPDGTGFLLADRLPTLAAAETYQLWAMVDGRSVSVGVLGSDPNVARFEANADASALAISRERAGGAAAPTQPAHLTGLLEAH